LDVARTDGLARHAEGGALVRIAGFDELMHHECGQHEGRIWFAHPRDVLGREMIEVGMRDED